MSGCREEKTNRKEKDKERRYNERKWQKNEKKIIKKQW